MVQGTMVQSVIEVNNLCTKLNGNLVHNDISFQVKAGLICALIAGSGGGKSVLLRQILGLMKPSSGSISVLGLQITSAQTSELNEIRNSVGVLFQNGALFSALSVTENVAVPLIEHSKLSPKEILEIVELKLALVGLQPEAAKLYPSQLSGGMRKRAALARALSLEPKLLFLDEPTSGLDPISSREFDRLIRTLNESLNLSIFFITHDPASLWVAADEVICLSEGKLIAQGSVAEVAKSEHPWLKSYFSEKRL